MMTDPHLVGFLFLNFPINPPSFSGVLLDNAQGLVNQPGPSRTDFLRRFNMAVKDALSFGLTSIHDAGLKPESLDFFKRSAFASYVKESFIIAFSLASDNALPVSTHYHFSQSKHGMIEWHQLRIYGMTFFDESKPYNGDAVQKIFGRRLTARSIKIFADGNVVCLLLCRFDL
jgi:predicted amidohydrolase YtcJ